MDIAYSKTREQYPLSPKKIIKKTISDSIAWVILVLILVGIPTVMLGSVASLSVYVGSAVGVLVVLLAVIVLVEYLYQRWYFAVYFYDLTTDFIQIKKGPITPREITVPYERIQDVYVDQDLLDRMLGIYDVHISSATMSSGMVAHIDGVEQPAAQGLREALLQVVKERISKNRA